MKGQQYLITPWENEEKRSDVVQMKKKFFCVSCGLNFKAECAVCPYCGAENKNDTKSFK